MRTNELEILKVIDCLIKNKRLTLKGEKNSFFSCFNIKGHDDENSIIKRRSVEREVKRLCDCHIFIEEDGVYSINPEYAVFEQESEINEWRDFLWKLLESGEYDTYLKVTKCILSVGEDNSCLDESELKIYQRTVKESLDNLKADKITIRKINAALDSGDGLNIEYKGNEYSIFPICYVISQDGTRTYLYAERKHALLLFDLQCIIVKGHYKAEIDRNKYISQVKKSWDIDIQDSVYIKLLYDKKAAEENCLDEIDSIERLLESHFGKAIGIYEEGKLIYQGEIAGINDFKAWLRKYGEYCIVLEPKKLQTEIVKALCEKRERYQNDR